MSAPASVRWCDDRLPGLSCGAACGLVGPADATAESRVGAADWGWHWSGAAPWPRVRAGRALYQSRNYVWRLATSSQRSEVITASGSSWGTCDADAVAVGEDLHLVTAGLLRRGGRGLLLHRAPTRRWYPDCWDLPGGHVEPDETPHAALQRELLEELGVTAVVSGPPFAQVHGEDFRMDVWVVDHWEGEPANLDPTEHDALAWLNHHEMSALRLADARMVVMFEAALR